MSLPASKPTPSGVSQRPTLVSAFRWAGTGIAYAFKTQRNMKIHGAFALGAVVIAILLQLSPLQWALIVGCIVVVFAAECVNTALEAAIDLVTDEYAPLARVAKDCAAGAVLICAIGAVVIGLLVYIPALINLFAS